MKNNLVQMSPLQRTYFTVPEKALEEVNESGFDVLSRAGAESFLSGQAFSI
ncbi:hypothetical protein [Clostridium sp. B9]|uniref:hypothetical protein n=1 Tax=Clostridium sp. B9 TaxID=3423224 RepID=UPI003D2EDC0C